MVKSRDLLTIVLVIILFLSIILIIHPINIAKAGEIITVGSGASYNFTTIQDAIDYANPGDTINVYSGTYNENIVINNESLTLKGVSGSSSTIIDGISQYDQTIKINADNTDISGFTVKNTGGTVNNKACIFINKATGCNIHNNIIKNSGADGIDIKSDGNNIYSNTIENNDMYGIYLLNSDESEIYNNIIQNNKRGFYISGSSSNNIHDNDIIGNSEYGIYLIFSNDNTMYLNHFSDNSINNSYESIYTNDWYYNSQGNYWDDYNNYDNNPEDGIGDDPYDISGDTGSQDMYPLGIFLQGSSPTAEIISIIPNPAATGQSITFNGNAIDDGTIVEWEWKINGVVRGTSEDFTLSNGLSSGTYNVKFRVRDDDSLWSNTATDTLEVNPSSSTNNEPIVTNLQATPNQTTYGKTIYFFGEGSDPDSGDSINDYEWSSDVDGFLSDQKTFSSKKLSVGTHIITLRVRDNHGAWSDPETLSIEINSDPSIENNPPVANAGGAYNGIVNVTATFNGSNSYDEDEGDSITNYYWDFGDGNTSNGETVEHIYTSAAQYTVTLTVTDSNGEQSQDITYIIIDETSNNQTSDGDNEKIIIPGFEIIFLFVSIIIIIIKKKQT